MPRRLAGLFLKIQPPFMRRRGAKAEAFLEVYPKTPELRGRDEGVASLGCCQENSNGKRLMVEPRQGMNIPKPPSSKTEARSNPGPDPSDHK